MTNPIGPAVIRRSPNNKPTGRIEIDRNNTFAKNLAACYAMGDGDDDTILHDISRNGNDLDDIVGNVGFQQSGKYGRSACTRNPNEAAHWFRDNSTVGGGVGKITVACLHRQRDYQSSGGSPFTRGNTASSSSMMFALREYSNQAQFNINLNGSIYSASAGIGLPLETWRMAIGTFDRTLSADRVKFYANGELLGTGAGIDFDTSAVSHPLIIGVGSKTSSVRSYDGDVALAAVWEEKAFTESEVISFTNNPWQIFKRRTIYIGEAPDLDLVVF